jgi:hypothetical protein
MIGGEKIYTHLEGRRIGKEEVGWSDLLHDDERFKAIGSIYFKLLATGSFPVVTFF